MARAETRVYRDVISEEREMLIIAKYMFLSSGGAGRGGAIAARGQLYMDAPIGVVEIHL